MGGKTKLAYPVEFRQQLVELVAAGRRPAELAVEFGCCAQSIADWVKKAGTITDLPRATQVMQLARSNRNAASQMALSNDERQELLRLRKQVKQLQIERDILSNSFGSCAAWFAHKSERTSMMFSLS